MHILSTFCFTMALSQACKAFRLKYLLLIALLVILCAASMSESTFLNIMLQMSQICL